MGSSLRLLHDVERRANFSLVVIWKQVEQIWAGRREWICGAEDWALLTKGVERRFEVVRVMVAESLAIKKAWSALSYLAWLDS